MKITVNNEKCAGCRAVFKREAELSKQELIELYRRV